MAFLQWNLLQFLGKSKKKKKKKSTDASKEVGKPADITSVDTASVQNTKLESEKKSNNETSAIVTSSNTTPAVTTTDPAKRLKNLRKKLREIEAIEKKILNGEIKAPDKDQKEKVSRKPDVLSEIMALELSLQN